MDNSLVSTLEGYVEAMFNDIKPTYGSNRDWERDKERSLHELVHRGERFLTIDLPALRKHFEKCLEECLYVPSRLYLSRAVSKKVQVPAFCRDLYLQIFDVEGKLRDQPNCYAIADLRQIYEGFGKLKNSCKQEAVDEEVNNFIKNEEDLRRPSLCWSEDILYEDSSELRSLSFCDSSDTVAGRGDEESLPGIGADFSAYNDRRSGIPKGHRDTLQKVCDLVSSEFGDLHLERDGESSELPKHGHGRVSNLPRTESKFDFSFWPAKLDRIFAYDRYAVHDLGYDAYLNDFDGLARNHEHSSKLIAVPKTMSGPRLIGSEPNYHQWIQQLIRSQIEGRVKETSLRFCISFGDQMPNRRLSHSGSIDRSIATVDLKSASDRLSCWTIERAFRSNITILDRIHASRTRTIRNAINGSFDRMILKKCFTQGSACTFPVQTVVYSMIAISAVLITEGSRVTTKSVRDAARKVRVFGDDIIVPTIALPNLKEILSFLQLTVNSNKTFSKGKFRESCGYDAYDGVDVTPARIKRFSKSPSHEIAQSMVEASNNFYLRGMWHVSHWIMSFLRKYKLPIAAPRVYESEYSACGIGYVSFQGQDLSHLAKRWNKILHREEYNVHFLASNSKKVPTHSAHDTTEYLFSSMPGSRDNLYYLDPRESGLGIVNKKSSVMRRGWKVF